MHSDEDIDYELKRGDTSPNLTTTLTDASGDPIDLRNVSSVEFHMKHVYADSLKIDSPATILDAANGVVAYEWASGETDATGLHACEFVVTYSDGTVESFPNDGDIHLYINHDVN